MKEMKQDVITEPTEGYSAKDFASDQEVRWCPGCGDYAILKAVQKVLPELNIPKEDIVFISGIGCASRFPYYLSTYGFHTIHGRAPTIATGVKLANPKLSVWIVTGDGDGLSIGANHLIHLMRRNIDVNILLLNNQIYGLTKGQYSPTSNTGLQTKSSPEGCFEAPLDPIDLALAANCSFVARAIDVDQAGLTSVLKQAAEHKGTSFVEIYQNCHVFNDGAFDRVRDRVVRPLHTVTLADEQPLVYGDNKALVEVQNNIQAKAIETDADKANILHYRTTREMAQRFNQLDKTAFPLPIGVFYQDIRPCLNEQIENHVQSAKQERPMQLDSLLHSGNTWEIQS